MIVYIDVKNGKVDLTKEQLEKLLNQKYNEGYADGKKVYNPITYSTCPYSYWSCPYHWTNKPSIVWTSSNSSSSSDNTITCTSTDQTISTTGYVNTTGTVTLPKTETTSASTTSSGLKINYNEVS